MFGGAVKRIYDGNRGREEGKKNFLEVARGAVRASRSVRDKRIRKQILNERSRVYLQYQHLIFIICYEKKERIAT